MNGRSIVPAFISLFAGGTAAVIAFLWLLFVLSGGAEMAPDLTDLEGLTTLRLFAVLFELTVPFLVVTSLVTGVLSRRELAAKLGLAFSAVAMALYVLAVHAMVAIATGA